MIISRVKSFISSALLGFLICAPTVFAQEVSTPRELVPRALTPVQNTSDNEGRTISGGINVQQLDQVSTEAIGVSTQGQNLPVNMWQGSKRLVVESLLAGLPASISSPTLRNLQEKLLSSAAQPPLGPQGPVNLLNIRASKLFEMGHYDQALAIINSVPNASRDASLKILEGQALLLKGDLEKACSLSAGQIQQDQNPFWVKSLALCRMLAGQGDQAMLSLSLLRELDQVDPFYDQMMNALQSGEKPEIETLASANALGLALINPTQAVLSEEIRRNATQTLNLLIVDAQHSTIEQRYAALISLQTMGFDVREKLDVLLSSLSFSEAEFGNALDLAASLEPTKAQALLYQVARKPNQLNVIKAETISIALDKALQHGTFKGLAKLYAPLVKSVNASADLTWFAPKAIRSLLKSGEMEAARPWLFLLQNAALRDETAMNLWIDIRPLAIFAGFEASGTDTGQALESWWNAHQDNPDQIRKATLMFALMEGLGLSVSEALWLQLSQDDVEQNNVNPKAVFWIKMNRGALENKIAQTITLQLLAFDLNKPQNLNPVFLRDSLFALRTIGLTDTARELALEIALSANL